MHNIFVSYRSIVVLNVWGIMYTSTGSHNESMTKEHDTKKT